MSVFSNSAKNRIFYVLVAFVATMAMACNDDGPGSGGLGFSVGDEMPQGLSPEAGEYLPGSCYWVQDDTLDGRIDHIFENIYDGDGNRVEQIYHHSGLRFEFDYDDDGNLVEERRYPSGENEPNRVEVNVYDQAGNLSEEWVDGELQYTHEYDGQNRRIATYDGDDEPPQAVREFEYDGAGNLVEERGGFIENEEFFLAVLEEHKYENGRIVETVVSMRDFGGSGEVELVELITFTYEDHGDGTYTRSQKKYVHPDKPVGSNQGEIIQSQDVRMRNSDDRVVEETIGNGDFDEITRHRVIHRDEAGNQYEVRAEPLTAQHPGRHAVFFYDCW